jgi:hypothetical protein
MPVQSFPALFVALFVGKCPRFYAQRLAESGSWCHSGVAVHTKMRALLLASFLVIGAAACSHTVVGEGGTEQSRSASQPLPTAGEACRCTSPTGTTPPTDCCSDSSLVCEDQSAPGQTTCDAIGCFRKGVCVDRSTSTAPNNNPPPVKNPPQSGFPPSTPDECSPFKNPPQGTCPAGQECHLVTDHWGCV